jgi:uncharacterized protein YlzI (FlbEa/FlbD family)
MFQNIKDGDHITLKLASGEEVIAKDKITSIAFINDKIKEEYKRVFSTIKTPTKPSIIT